MKLKSEETWSVETASRRELEIQKLRCEEEDHDWENCCSIFLKVYQQCKWCGERQ